MPGLPALASILELMHTSMPDSRLSYITEGVILEGGSVIGYERVEDGTPGWIIHVSEPTLPNVAMVKRLVPDDHLDIAKRRESARFGLVSDYKRCLS